MPPVPHGVRLAVPGRPEVRFHHFFDKPIFDGDHSPLVLGWSDDQLRSIVDRLAEWLPKGLPEGMRLATASCARSIVAEKRLTGRAVHFARGKEAYGGPRRYRSGDLRYTPGTTSPIPWTFCRRPV